MGIHIIHYPAKKMQSWLKKHVNSEDQPVMVPYEFIAAQGCRGGSFLEDCMVEKKG